MHPDDDFYKHLGSLVSGSERQTSYRNYKNAKNNYCFELNGTLKGGLPLGSNLSKFYEINQVIRAKNRADIKVYRMTSDYEFTPSGPRVELKESFRYPCFLSTTRNVSSLSKFYPSCGTPTVLEFSIPADTTMALMENSHNPPCEEEILLGAGTEFKITNIKKITDISIRTPYVGNFNLGKCGELYFLSIDVVSNPPHLSTVAPSDFFLW